MTRSDNGMTGTIVTDMKEVATETVIHRAVDSILTMGIN